MYNPQLSRRELLRGAARGAVAVPTISFYEKAAAAAGAAGGLVGIIRTRSFASSYEISGLQALRAYAERVYKEADEKTKANIQKFGLAGHYWKEPDIFDDYIDGRRVQVRVRVTGIDEKGNNRYDLETRIFDPSNRRARMSYDGRFDYNDNERFWDRGIKGNLLGPRDFVHIKKGDSQNWESGIWNGPGGYQLRHWKTKKLRKGEICGSDDDFIHLGICLDEDGSAVFSTGKEGEVYHYRPPELWGFYKTTTHEKLQERHMEAFKISNAKYQRILTIVINQLVKQGKLKIG